MGEDVKQLIDPIEYYKVDKISDDVYGLSPDIALKFNVSLAKYGQGSKRYHFHKEYEYPSRSGDTRSLVTVKRSFDYYLSIESTKKDQDGNKLFIRIGPSEYFMLKKGLDEAYAWFNDKKYSKLFAKNKGELVLMPPIPNFLVSHLPQDKYIMLMPTIVDKGLANADKEAGVRMFLDSESYYINLTLDRFMGLYYIYSCFNMYQSAIEMINYLGRPDFGFNRFVIGNSIQDQEEDTTNPMHTSKSSGIIGRVPPGLKQSISLLE